MDSNLPSEAYKNVFKLKKKKEIKGFDPLAAARALSALCGEIHIVEKGAESHLRVMGTQETILGSKHYRIFQSMGYTD